MALKLWGQMNEHQEKGTCELTFGCTDPLQAGVMAKYQQVRTKNPRWSAKYD
jgi:isocitrate lyase